MPCPSANKVACGGDACADAFIVAFHEVLDAVNFTLNFQQGLLTLQWPEEMLVNSHAMQEMRYNGGVLFKGLRVRAAMHTGIPTAIEVSL